MNGFEIVAGIVGAFFVLGVAVGIIVMIALSAIRYRRVLHGEDGHRRRNYPLGWPDQGSPNSPTWPGGYREGPDADDGPDSGGYGDGPPTWPTR